MFKPFIVIASLALTACTVSPHQTARQPKIIKKISPTYPYYAWKNRKAGFVDFNYDVGADGKVSEMRIKESEPQHLFDDAAISAMAQWRFEPNRPFKNLHLKMIFRINNDTNPLAR